MRPLRVLVVRPSPDAEATVRELADRGHRAVVAPVLAVRPLAAVLPPVAIQAVLMTSASAARALGELPDMREVLRPLPLLAVGPRTAEAAHEAGFVRVTAADGDGEALIGLARQVLRPDAGALLHASGREVAVDIGARLAPLGFDVRRIAVYEAVAADTLPEAAADAARAGALDAVLLHSPRTARILVSLILRAGLETRFAGLAFICLSRAVAEPLRQRGWRRIALAASPDGQALLAALEAAQARE